ncbi:MAG: alpha/beta hydrolase [Gemmatimonadota bacterium]|nr:alpha/beta hydrolase [Gemmatimonadota bacterium]
MSRRRLRPEECWPAGVSDVGARRLALRSGLAVRVVESGRKDARPVLLVHGWGGTSYTWRKQLPALAAAGFHPIAVDLKGHGLSDKPHDPAEYRLEALVAHLRDVMDALGLARAPIVAQSLGGRISLELAFTDPERVERLALVSSVGFGRVSFAGLLPRLVPTAAVPHLPRFAPRPVVAAIMRRAYGSLAPRDERDVDEYWSQGADPGFVRALHSLLLGVDMTPLAPDRLQTLPMPWMAIEGTRDRIVRRARLHPAVDALRRSRLEIVDGAGHLVNEESPEPVNAALLRFLAT